jgi:hypothetical protein
MTRLTEKEFEKLYGVKTLESLRNIKPSNELKGFSLGETMQDIKQTGSNLLNTAKKTVTNMAKATSAQGQTRFEKKFQTLGAGAMGLSQAVGDLTVGGAKVALPQAGEDAIKESITNIATPVVQSAMENPFIQSLMSNYQNLDERSKRNIDATLGFGALATEFGVGGLAKRPLQAGIKAGIESAENVISAGLKSVDNVATKAGDLTSGVRDIVRPTVDTLKNIPQRASINIAERKAVEQTIQKLPTESAKTAVREGIELPDIEYLYSIPKSQKKPLNKLFKVVEDFATGKTKTNPIEVVGKPIVDRIKDLESKATTIGKQLGDTANKLPDVTDIEIQPVVLGELQKVNGLRGLKVADDGVLDFTDTSLASALSKSDQNAIQSAYETAIKSGTGKSKHLLRQELFEILGGKKKSLTNITDTQEKAYEAIRKGLSDVLETKNASYKKLSNEYRKTIQPLQDIRRFMKNVAGADEDILDMSAGLLARRLTSNAGSNPQLRQILRNLDNATKVKGKTSLNIENLQDFYNVLEKYYPEITSKTSLKGQVEGAIESVGGIGDLAVKVGEKIIGRSDAVKRKVLRDAIIDALK